MKTFLITFNNNVLFRLVINMSRNKAASFGNVGIITENDREWFDRTVITAVSSVDRVLLPITLSRSSIGQVEVRFTLSQPENISLDILADLMEKALTSIVYRQWCLLHGFSSEEEDHLAEIKRIVLGIGVKFKRKNEK